MSPELLNFPTVEKRLARKTANEAQAKQLIDVAYAVQECGGSLADYLPEGRCKALAITKLEEALFWASRAVVEG